MTVKHQPATALPWHTIGEGRTIVNNNAAEVCFPIGSKAKREPNVTYIAHAANAYPKLVRALRRLRHADTFEVREAADEASALLREIGEDQ